MGVKNNRVSRGSNVDYCLQVLDRPPSSAIGLSHRLYLIVLQRLVQGVVRP